MCSDNLKEKLDCALSSIDFLLAKTDAICDSINVNSIQEFGVNSVADAIISTRSCIEGVCNSTEDSIDELRTRISDLEAKFEYISNIGLPPVFDMFSPTEVFSILVKSKAAEELSEQESKTLDRIISSLAAYILINKINN